MEKTVERREDRSARQVRALVLTALLAAMACAATMAIRVPTPTGGYVNLGDAVVLLGAYLLGPGWGAAAAGIGSALADLLGGYPMYVPATLVIKAVMAALAAGLYRLLGRRGGWTFAVCGAAAEVPMVLGYWLFDALLASFGGRDFSLALAGAAAGIPGNLVQAAFGAAASALLAAALRKSAFVCREFPHL
ncbi:ECF transporter S component [Dysosmobacter sp. Marseille-Q4140]|nr:ECF transporter S component [Dysosmobacter sp. Marseille-Q4140]